MTPGTAGSFFDSRLSDMRRAAIGRAQVYRRGRGGKPRSDERIVALIAERIPGTRTAIAISRGDLTNPILSLQFVSSR